MLACTLFFDFMTITDMRKKVRSTISECPSDCENEVEQSVITESVYIYKVSCLLIYCGASISPLIFLACMM